MYLLFLQNLHAFLISRRVREGFCTHCCGSKTRRKRGIEDILNFFLVLLHNSRPLQSQISRFLLLFNFFLLSLGRDTPPNNAVKIFEPPIHQPLTRESASLGRPSVQPLLCNTNSNRRTSNGNIDQGDPPPRPWATSFPRASKSLPSPVEENLCLHIPCHKPKHKLEAAQCNSLLPVDILRRKWSGGNQISVSGIPNSEEVCYCKKIKYHLSFAQTLWQSMQKDYTCKVQKYAFKVKKWTVQSILSK